MGGGGKDLRWLRLWAGGNVGVVWGAHAIKVHEQRAGTAVDEHILSGTKIPDMFCDFINFPYVIAVYFRPGTAARQVSNP